MSSLFLAGLISIAGCKDDGSSNQETETTTQEGESSTDAPVKGGRKATHSVWDNHSLVDAPNGKGKWLASIKFGEDMEWGGDSAVDATSKKTYYQVTLSDGKSGWVRRDLIEPNSMLGAVLDEAPVYSRPGVNNITNDAFAAGALVVVTTTKDDYTQVTGSNLAPKRLKGWVLGKGIISTESADLNTAVQFARARAEQDAGKKLEKLNAILDNPACEGSSLLEIVANMKDSLNTSFAESDIGDSDGGDEGSDEGDSGDDALTINGDGVNLRSDPSVSPDNKVAQFNKGQKCTILEQGKLEAINGKLDYWYKVNCGGSTGWVFGAFTSKKQE
jgi:hypothetical protein